jgi:hypothetical protein
MRRDEAADILGLSHDAGPEAARDRYHHLARLLHPDKGGSTALFQLVGVAHDTLTGRCAPDPEPPAARPPPARRPPARRPRPTPSCPVRPPQPIPASWLDGKRLNRPPSVPVFVAPPPRPVVETPIDHSWPGVKVATPEAEVDDDDW